MLYASLASQLCTVPSFRHATMKRIPTLLFRLDREPNWWPLPEKRDVQKGVWFLLKQMKGMGTICLWKRIWPLTQKNKRLTVVRGHHAVMRDGGAASKCTCIQHGATGGLVCPVRSLRLRWSADLDVMSNGICAHHRLGLCAEVKIFNCLFCLLPL